MSTNKELQGQVKALQATVANRLDGWANIFTGMGIKGRDKTLGTKWIQQGHLDEPELNSLYRGDGFSQRIVDLPAYDMIREWLKIVGDDENNVLEKMKDLSAKYHCNRLLKWARLYGGGLMIVGVKDGGLLEEPLNRDNIQSVEFLRVEHRYRVQEIAWETDAESENFGKVTLYQVSPIRGTPYTVHASRTFRIDGVDVPDSIRQENNSWGDSVLQAVYGRLKGLGEGYANINVILSEYVLGVMKIKDLKSMIASGRESLVTKRLNLIDMSKHILNTIMLDADDETFERLPAGGGGIELLINKLIQALSAVTGIPVTLLMGDSPAGLKATGASDIRFYYDMISARQEEKLQPLIEWLTKLIMWSKSGPFNGVEPEGWQVEFNPLWQPTEAEKVETHNKQSDTDQRYVDMGVLSPEEIRESRFGGRSYSTDTILSNDVNSEKLGEDKEGESNGKPSSGKSNSTLQPTKGKQTQPTQNPSE